MRPSTHPEVWGASLSRQIQRQKDYVRRRIFGDMGRVLFQLPPITQSPGDPDSSARLPPHNPGMESGCDTSHTKVAD
eukprot:44289-Eustigmatos_ZCMA.PRE.1